jgi:serine acetyltransferase
VRQDALFAHGLRYPGRRPGWATWPRVLVESRGLHVLAMTRATFACNAWRPQGRAERLVRGLTRTAVVLMSRVCSILARSEITIGHLDGGVHLSRRGHIIVGMSTVGAGTIIHDHVTIGRGDKWYDLPTIGRRVWIGPRCVIFGKITIGDGATILPDTVLSRSVPSGWVVQGNPAVIVRRSCDNTDLLRTDDPEVARLLASDGSR